MRRNDNEADRSERFCELVERAAACRLCSRMEGRSRVLGNESGSAYASLLFVGEAPGRLGADRTGKPFSGDRSGRDFERLLKFAGLERADVFVTNAVLCNPRDERGRNSRPKQGEIGNCRQFLQETIDLVDPKIVVALGNVALEALNAIAPHRIVLAENVGEPIPWYSRVLVPLYHPSARAQIRRPFSFQCRDYAGLGDLLREMT
jgi:uracil-DNA glycosylase family 4